MKILKLMITITAVLLTLTMFGCDIQINPNSLNKGSASSGKESTESDARNSNETVEQAPDKTYQSILDDYSARLAQATPTLIAEYNNEAARNTEGLMGLAQLSNEKIMELAEISNDGISEMAKLYFSQGSGSYDEYEEWARKLQDVYMDEAQKITDVYLDSAM